MGDIFLELTVANIHDTERQQELSFLVDTGATRAWIPREIAERLGIQEIGTIPLQLADGTVRELPYGYCLFDFGGESVAGNVVLGPTGSEPIAGTHLLQDFRLVIDMEHHTISRGRAMRAK
ncbi:MAG: aspartyl protease family protein [Chloroflexi bacterium]|nr:aspartyl protease family protein [Chloroflexota bacterium]